MAEQSNDGGGRRGRLPALALIWGEDEFLLRESAHDLLAEHGLRADEIDAAEWRGGETSDLATPSLFGERRALLVTGAQGLSEAASAEIRAYLAAHAAGPRDGDDSVLVLTAISRGRSGPAIGKAVSAAGGAVRQVTIRRQDLPGWVLGRAKRRGVSMSSQTAAALIASVGDGPAELDQAVEQLRTAFPNQPVGPEQVRAQFRGLGDQQIWDLCDRALAGRLGDALVALRSLLEDREAGLLILGGIAARVRDLIRVRSLPDRMPPAEAAKAAGLRFDWQVRRYREQAGRFTKEELESLHERVAEADRAIKGGVADDVVLPGVVAALAGRPDVGHLQLPEPMGR
ncbi:MAG TPA: DNA polymerase III subunit delta [Actinomycetota bacterium]|nr:DNA polymerase III subunit delta [Actinomycetota bacterium]